MFGHDEGWSLENRISGAAGLTYTYDADGNRVEESADLADPQSLNLFTFVRNLPTTKIDVDGHEDGVWDTIKEWFRHLVQPAMDVHDSKGAAPAVDRSPYSPMLHTTTRQVVVNATEDISKGLEITAAVASLADFTGLGNAGAAAMRNDPTSALAGMAFMHIPGGGSIAMTEAKSLVGAWSNGSFATRAASIGYHFGKHGADVGAKNAWQYMRKAESFSKHLKGATSKDLGDGATRYYKAGKYIDLNKDKKILSFGNQ